MNFPEAPYNCRWSVTTDGGRVTIGLIWKPFDDLIGRRVGITYEVSAEKFTEKLAAEKMELVVKDYQEQLAHENKIKEFNKLINKEK